MGAKMFHDVASLASSVRPGIMALVASELEYLIDEHMAEIRKSLVKRISTAIEVRVRDVLDRDGIEVHVKCDVGVKDGN
jgi:hypothetical protein